jgi:MarR family transcriptional regulator for hemolysin
MPRPALVPPIGLRLTRTAHAATQAFERAMAQAGGSAAAFQVLVLVRAQEWGTQAEMAAAMGITPATLTHHLNQLDRQGLVRRWREEGNRRSQRVELTPQGEAEFDRLRAVAIEHDARLRGALCDGEVEELARLLDKLSAELEPGA